VSHDQEPPLLLGYIRADLLRNGTKLPQARAQLQTFADREQFNLGGVAVAEDDAPATFSALMAEVGHYEAAWGIVVPDLRHLTDVEQLILARDADGWRTAIFAASPGPRSGGPGGRFQTRVRPAVPPLPHGPGSLSTSPNWW
jgi:hypothetical protein